MAEIQKIQLSELRPIAQNEEANCYDLGDGIACLEFRSPGNSVTTSVRVFVYEVLEHVMDGFDGLIIGNQGKNFSAGANLQAVKKIIDEKNLIAAKERVEIFQNMTTMIKQYRKPIVAAPFGMTLGGGMEIALYSHKRVASPKLYGGLVEIGVGLLPGGGGLKETALSISNLPKEKQETALLSAFEALILKKVSADAQEAKKMGYLSCDDVIVESHDQLLGSAKECCLDMLKSWEPKTEDKEVHLLGQNGYEQLLIRADQLVQERKISEYDRQIAQVVAEILTGGNSQGDIIMKESEILFHEREGFVSLTQWPQTYERICHFINTGKLLEN